MLDRELAKAREFAVIDAAMDEATRAKFIGDGCNRDGDGGMSYRAVWRSAHQLVLEHCDEAPLHAAMNADRELAKGDLDRYRFWLGVARSFERNGRRVPVAGERLN